MEWQPADQVHWSDHSPGRHSGECVRVDSPCAFGVGYRVDFGRRYVDCTVGRYLVRPFQNGEILHTVLGLDGLGAPGSGRYHGYSTALNAAVHTCVQTS